MSRQLKEDIVKELIEDSWGNSSQGTQDVEEIRSSPMGIFIRMEEKVSAIEQDVSFSKDEVLTTRQSAVTKDELRTIT